MTLDNSTDRWRRRAWLLLAALPIIYIVLMVCRYGYDAPYMDMWSFLMLVEKSFDGTLTLTDLWRQHNEQREFFPLLIITTVGRLSSLNYVWEWTIILVLAITMYCLVIIQANRMFSAAGIEGSSAWFTPLASFLMFTMAQWQVWLWGMHITITLGNTASIASLCILCRERLGWKHLGFAAALALVATQSHPCGTITWFVGLGILGLRVMNGGGTRSHVVVWLGMLCVGMFSYLYGYEQHPVNVPPTETIQHPLRVAKYAAIYLGAPLCGFDWRVAIMLGLMGVCVTGGLVVSMIAKKRVGLMTLLPALAMAIYALGCAVLTGLGRSYDMESQALSSRYMAFSTFLWIAFLLLLTLANSSCEKTMRSRFHRWRLPVSVVLVCFLSLITNLHGLYRADERYDGYVPAREALIAGGPPEMLVRLHPRVDVVMRGREILIKHKLNVFRERNVE